MLWKLSRIYLWATLEWRHPQGVDTKLSLHCSLLFLSYMDKISMFRTSWDSVQQRTNPNPAKMAKHLLFGPTVNVRNPNVRTLGHLFGCQTVLISDKSKNRTELFGFSNKKPVWTSFCFVFGLTYLFYTERFLCSVSQTERSVFERWL